MIEIHFLNVGHGDCTIIKFDSKRIAMIDINNSKVLDEDSRREIARRFGYSDELLTLYEYLRVKPDKIKKYEETLTDPVEYYQKKFGEESIFRFILTHPDMDHMTGLYRLNTQEGIPILNFWDTKHSVTKSDDPKDWENTGYDIRDWRHYKVLRKSESSPRALFYLRGDQYSFFKEDSIHIWSPFEHQEDISEDNEINELSYILFIQHGKCNIMLGGDATTEVWQQIYESRDGKFPKIHLLKASHHGRKTGYHWQSIKAMAPDYTVVSVGELKKKEDAFASYEKYSEKGCFSTRLEGDIVAKCWLDGDVWLYNGTGERL